MLTLAAIVSCLVGLNVIAAIICDAFVVEPGKTLFPLGFRLRRVRNWLPMGIVYCGFYSSRYNMAAANVPSVSKDSRMMSGSIPLALSLGFWSYAITAPWTGMYADRVGGRRAMLLATYAALACNLVTAFLAWVPEWDGVARTALILIFYSTNIVFQGFGTSAVVKINSMWYGPKEKGTFSGVFNVLVTSGYFTSLSVGSFVAKTFGFPGLFVLPSVLLGVGGFFIQMWVQDQPERHWSAAVLDNLPSCRNSRENELLIEKDDKKVIYSSVKQSKMKHSENDNRSASAKLSSDAVFVCYCAAIFFLSLVRDGLLSWIYSFLEFRRKTELSLDASSMLGAGITFGGFLGGISCGVMSDIVFQGSRIQPILVFTSGQILALAVLWFYGGRNTEAFDAFCIFLTCFFVCGNYSLLNYTIPSDLDSDVVGTAVGLMTMTGYMASGLGGFTMHLLIEYDGYRAWAGLLVISSVLAACTIIGGGIVIEQRRKKKSQGRSALFPEDDHAVTLSMRMSNSSDIDMVAGLLSSSILETDL